MKITKSTLRRLIKEELKNLTEGGLFEQDDEGAPGAYEEPPEYKPKPFDLEAAKEVNRGWKKLKKYWESQGGCYKARALRTQSLNLSIDARHDKNLPPQKKKVIVAKLRAIRKDIQAAMTARNC